ncbi:MAG: 3-dehydroquinate synthase [Candidatus Krumholzibacteriia bacterium]
MTNVVLCGFMGTGKTVVGRLLARLLGREFYDLDAVIEEHAGRSVAEIFAAAGEAGFRSLEREAVLALAPAAGRVLATGGGVLLDPANRQALAAGGRLVLLTASPAVLAARLAGDRARPLLAGASDPAARIAELLTARTPIYAGLDVAIDTSGLLPIEAAVAVARAVGIATTVSEIEVAGAAGHAPLAARNLTATRVVTGRGAALTLGDVLRDRGVDGHVVLAMPPVVARHHGEALAAAIAAADLSLTTLEVPDGDRQKSFDHAVQLVDRLAELGCDRSACIVAAGGGVTGDLMGFVASLYMRGIALVNVPTTLLAMVDAHLGGKTGVNTPRAKNLAGAFHPPLAVVADPVLLNTLPGRELACGLAEVVKTALIGDAELFEILEAALLDPAGPHARRDPVLLDRCVAGCVAVKGGVVTRDPWELGERRVLNLGHTLGHALEAQRELELSHGEAVSLGLVAACRLAVDRGLAGGDLRDRTRRLLAACGLPVTPPPVADDLLRARLRLDKKRQGPDLRFVLPTGLGRAIVVDDVTEDEALRALNEERACASS